METQSLLLVQGTKDARKDEEAPSHSIIKRRSIRPKKSDLELIKTFWDAPPEALFGQEVIALIMNLSVKTLESNRWRGRGLPFKKISGRILYQKSDVITFLEGHELVKSTSEYKSEKI